MALADQVTVDSSGSSVANGIAAVAVGAFILTALVKGNGSQLWTMVKGETGFIKWGIAVAIIWWIATRKEFGSIGPMLIFVAVIGVAFKIATDPTIMSGITNAWNALPTPAKATGNP
jgi:hypothetical protein